MSAGPLVLWLIAAALGVIAYSRADGRHRKGLEFALGQFVVLLPRIILALLTAGFVSTLVPAELIAAWLGPESGWRGIVIASLFGGLVPGGPVIIFPVAVLLATAGAGIPQLVAFITAWSVFAVHRILLFELPLIGWRFTALRLLSSFPLPVIAGLLSGGLAG
ncbi:MAG: hypothetical protein ACE5KF_02085 [Kiloniellaceae bacterium]